MNIIITISQRILAAIYRVLAFFWYDLEVVDGKNVKKLHGPLVIVANHKSYADHFFIGAALPYFIFSRVLPIRIMAKDRFFAKPISRMIFRSLGTYPARYKQGIEASLENPLAILKRSGVVGIYPEGGIVYEDGIGDFRRGVGELLKRSGEVLVVPVSIWGSVGMHAEIFPRFRQRVVVSYGEPFTVNAEQSAEDITDSIRSRIVELYSAEKELAAMPAIEDTATYAE
jgi:1-acyl-sn-glycerol-3-phosphate acyltransferase